MKTTQFFSGSAPANYERYSGEPVFEPYALDLAKRLRREGFVRALEVACGTGRVTRHLAAMIPEGGTLYATDISPDMISLAKTIVKDGRIVWETADAHALPFEEGGFDLVVCQFGAMFFRDKQTAFSELFRVLARKGKLYFNVWDSPAENPRNRIAVQLLKTFFEETPGDLELPFSWYHDGDIRSVLSSCGFRNIQAETVQKSGFYKGVDEIIEAFTWGSVASAYMREKTPEQRENFSRLLRSEYVRAFGEKNLSIPMQAIVYRAEK